MKLTIELVPRTSWFSNVRNEVSKKDWDIIRKASYLSAGYKCEICKDIGTNQGFRHKLECHEIWDFNDATNEQVLKGMISLCPKCHKVKHFGLAQMKGEHYMALDHLMKVNEMTQIEAEKYVSESFDIWAKRSEKEWKLNISYLDENEK